LVHAWWLFLQPFLLVHILQTSILTRETTHRPVQLNWPIQQSRFLSYSFYSIALNVTC
jgi:hypothetical protein